MPALENDSEGKASTALKNVNYSAELEAQPPSRKSRIAGAGGTVLENRYCYWLEIPTL